VDPAYAVAARAAVVGTQRHRFGELTFAVSADAGTAGHLRAGHTNTHLAVVSGSTLIAVVAGHTIEGLVNTTAEGITSVGGARLTIIAVDGGPGNALPVDTTIAGSARVPVLTLAFQNGVHATFHRVTIVICAPVVVVTGVGLAAKALPRFALLAHGARVPILAQVGVGRVDAPFIGSTKVVGAGVVVRAIKRLGARLAGPLFAEVAVGTGVAVVALTFRQAERTLSGRGAIPFGARVIIATAGVHDTRAATTVVVAAALIFTVGNTLTLVGFHVGAARVTAPTGVNRNIITGNFRRNFRCEAGVVIAATVTSAAGRKGKNECCAPPDDCSSHGNPPV